MLHFKSGALGTLLVSDTVSAPWSWEWGSRENPNRPHDTENCYIVAGTKGSITVPTLQHRWHEPGAGELGQSAARRCGSTCAPADAYHEQMRNFANVIRGTETAGAERPRRHDHARNHAGDHALAETGAPVRVADMMTG